LNIFKLPRFRSPSSPAEAVVQLSAGKFVVRDEIAFASHEVRLKFATRILSVAEIQSVSIEPGLAIVSFPEDQYDAAGVVGRAAAALISEQSTDQVGLSQLLQFSQGEKCTVFRHGSTFSMVDQSIPRPAPPNYLVRTPSQSNSAPGNIGSRSDSPRNGDSSRGNSHSSAAKPMASLPLARGMKRLAYLGMAAGSFGLSIVGIIVPGIPTVPFVLMTSYYLVQSWPSLNDRLMRSPTFGPMLRDWRDHGALSPRVKLISLAVMAATLTATIAIGNFSAPAIFVIAVMVCIGLFYLYRIPTVGTQNRQPRSLEQNAVTGLSMATA
jgi:uncharacterized membrane protein YbaN (DUF454 family)